MIEKTFPKTFPTNTIKEQPGVEKNMNPRPIFQHEEYYVKGDRLKNKVAIITGGDSGIGRAISVAYAKEGAKVCIIYFNEEGDANETKSIIEGIGGECLLIKGDIGDESFCNNAVKTVIEKYNKIDIFISNAGEQHPINNLGELTYAQIDRTFRTNIYGALFMCKALEQHLKEGASIILTT